MHRDVESSETGNENVASAEPAFFGPPANTNVDKSKGKIYFNLDKNGKYLRSKLEHNLQGSFSVKSDTIPDAPLSVILRGASEGLKFEEWLTVKGSGDYLLFKATESTDTACYFLHQNLLKIKSKVDCSIKPPTNVSIIEAP